MRLEKLTLVYKYFYILTCVFVVFVHVILQIEVFLRISILKQVMIPTSSPYILVKKSSVHNRGIFAKTIQYVGEKITKKESDARGERQLSSHLQTKETGAVYIFELNKRYDIDGNVSWNTAKYINHSCNPNCETEIINNQIWIVAMRNIKQEEELHYDYGYALDDYEEHPCKCGAKNCVGYIVGKEHWPKLRRELSKKNKQ